eukprot:Nk52_evm17s272 gene=Nk52_evmTU17s272
MEFSEVFKQSNNLVVSSPDGQYCAHTVNQTRVVIRHSGSLQILHMHQCVDAVDSLQWSMDSLYLLCAIPRRGVVQVWALEQPDWTCKIDEGAAGLVSSCWSPDGRHILNVSEFNLRVTVWSLVSKQVVYMRNPKFGKIKPSYFSTWSHAKYQHYKAGVSGVSTMMRRLSLDPEEQQQQGGEVRKEVDGEEGLLEGNGNNNKTDSLLTRPNCYLALPERADCKDTISVYSVLDQSASSSWTMVSRFKTATRDLQDISWSPDGTVICVWDSLLDYKVLLYSIDGRCLASYSPYGDVCGVNVDVNGPSTGLLSSSTSGNGCSSSLGIQSVTWSSSNQFLAVGSFDQHVRILNHVTWKSVVDHDHPNTITNQDTDIFKEIDVSTSMDHLDFEEDETAASTHPTRRYELVSAPYRLPSLPSAAQQQQQQKSSTNSSKQLTLPKQGVVWAEFSADSKYLATRNERQPCVVWVWDMNSLSLRACMVHLQSIKTNPKWHPRENRLAVCTGGPRVYFWTPEGCLCVDIPGTCPPSSSSSSSSSMFRCGDLRWTQDGDKMVLMSGTQFCFLFV